MVSLTSVALMMITFGVRGTSETQAWVLAAMWDWLSKTRSLRHIHVTLGLRHPWLRTVLESQSHTPAPNCE